MTTLQEELAWEKTMIERGMYRYDASQKNAVEGDRVADTSAGNRLLKSYLLQIEDQMRETIFGHRNTSAMKVLRSMETSKLAYIALKCMLSCVYEPERVLTSVCTQIGSKVEDEFHMMEIEANHKNYFDQAFRQNKSTHYRHLRNSIIQAARNNTSFEPNYWNEDQRAKVGLVLQAMVLEACDLFEHRVGYKVNQTGKWGKQQTFLVPTQQCVEWVQKHDDVMRMMFPDRMPTLIPPAEWVGYDDGGYWHPKLRRLTPFVIASKSNPTAAKERYSHIGKQVYRAANALQNTGWCINERVLAVMKEVWTKNLGVGMPRSEPYDFPPCPLAPGATAQTEEEQHVFEQWKNDMRAVHAKEAERSALCMLVSRSLRIAQELKDKEQFYYVYRADFRGRLYAASTGISPQGPDQGKALLQFAKAKPIGESGLYWLKVHGANKWGMDKCSGDEQVAWIEERHEQWCAVANDPVGQRALWADADKPYQFLAFCFEYEEATRVGAEFRSRLPIARDGSCNGLQHFSAMLRDAVGGKAVNLVPQDKPADIYQEVADVSTDKLIALAKGGTEQAPAAMNWLKLFYRLYGENPPRMKRKLPKKPVMTLPYGSTRQTCTESIYDWYRDEDGEFFGKTGFRHAIFLTPVLWESIGEVVIAARAAMSWIQKCAGAVAKEGHAFEYRTPLGFPVYHKAYKFEIKEVRTRLFGGTRIKVQIHTDEINAAKMRSGSSPNYVHSMDATHLMMVVNACLDAGIQDFAMIHDDFGCHACHVEDFDRIIREQFCLLYGPDRLADLRAQLEAGSGCDLPPTPPMGDLNLDDVKRSKYFFW